MIEIDVILLIGGVALGALVGWAVARFRAQAELARQALSDQNATMELRMALARATAENTASIEKLNAQKREFDELRRQSELMFKNLANEILEEKSRRFTEQNKTNMAEILTPLNERIREFERTVSDTHLSEVRERASLVEQIRNLHQLNQQMSIEANNLTNALRGQSKTQGNWGEFLLESVLEKSGLVKGREYVAQMSLPDAEGRRFQPDVIVNLPESKHLVIDSKVSLNAYERYCSADTADARAEALKEHLLSIRKHMRELSEKNYHALYGLQSLDFVIMFVPVEPAFIEAVNGDATLFADAYERNIIIVAPSLLLATMRVIASIWRQERHTTYASEIARQAGDLYDKFVGLAEDLAQIGRQIDLTKNSHTEAMKKLTEGNGNIVRRIERLKSLGAKANKSIPPSLLDNADELPPQPENGAESKSETGASEEPHRP
ncbi:MAG TPA: DNA recombination protein RmuC [Bacteroidota bacterium]|nr:DNA recombination protein RmuC [Bacteroidota bacterium]